MSEFELVTIVLSFIVGFGVHEILSSFVTIARDPDRKGLDWLPIAWALIILVHQFQFWFGTLYVERALGLSVAVFWLMILLAILLYLAGGLILPSTPAQAEARYSDDFESRGVQALLPLTAFTAIAAVINGVTGLGWTQPPVSMNVALTVLSAITLARSRRSVRVFATITYCAVMVWGVLFVWSRPGSIAI